MEPIHQGKSYRVRLTDDQIDLIIIALQEYEKGVSLDKGKKPGIVMKDRMRNAKRLIKRLDKRSPGRPNEYYW